MNFDHDHGVTGITFVDDSGVAVVAVGDITDLPACARGIRHRLRERCEGGGGGGVENRAENKKTVPVNL